MGRMLEACSREQFLGNSRHRLQTSAKVGPNRTNVGQISPELVRFAPKLMSISPTMSAPSGVYAPGAHPHTHTRGEVDHLTFLGSALFTRRVSGPRVVLCAMPSAAPPEQPEPDGAGEKLKVKGRYCKTVDGTKFQSYGAHTDVYSSCYLTAACAIGAEREDLEAFLARFESVLHDYRKGAGRKDKESSSKARDKEKVLKETGGT